MFIRKTVVLISLVLLYSILFIGCNDTGVNPGESTASAKLFIIESDLQSGYLEWMSLQQNVITEKGLSIYSDAVSRTYKGNLYILERFGADNIIKFDPSKNDQSGVVYQRTLGKNWNPQDIEFVNDNKAYISNANEPKITVWNPSTGTVIRYIDISAYIFNPDSNSSPYANDLQLVGEDIYVLMQRRDGFKPGGNSLLARINTTTDVIVDTISLQYKNGHSMTYAAGALYISNPGDGYVIGDGAVEKIDLASKTVTTVIDEKTLGGNPNAIIHKNSTLFYVTNYIVWQNVQVVELDAATGSISTLPGINDAFGGIYYDSVDELLYVGERDSVATGVYIFKNNVQTAGPVKSERSLPPIDFIVVR